MSHRERDLHLPLCCQPSGSCRLKRGHHSALSMLNKPSDLSCSLRVLPSRPFSILVTFLWTYCAHVHCVKPCLLKHILETVMFIIPCKCWNRGDEVNGFRDYWQNFPTLLHAVKSWVTVMIIVKVSLPLLEGSSDMPLRAMCRENFTTFPLYLWKASRCLLGFCQLLVYVPFIPENIYFPFSLY